MLVVIPFCRRDEMACLKNLELCKMLDGSYDYECLISTDSTCSIDRVQEAASSLFKKVYSVRYDAWGGEKDWPTPQNFAWQSTARHIYSRFPGVGSWFWWEPDATPVQAGWLKALEKSHVESGKLFTGAMGNTVSSVAIYPVNVMDICPPALMVRKIAFVEILREPTMRMVNPTDLIQQVLNGRPTFQDQRTVKKTLIPTAVLFHRCKDGSLADRMMEMMDPNRAVTAAPNVPANVTYRHSGPFGDIIYSLAVIKAKGGGHLIVGDSPGPQIKMTKERYENILPLLEIQPYIRAVEFETTGSQVDHDLDAFRPLLREDNYPFGKTIMACIAQIAGVECPPDDKPWLTVDHSIAIDGKPIVINRTVRYRNHKFPWQKVREKYADKCIFLGTQDEYELMKFQYDWSELTWFKTRNMLEAARVVNGCKLYIGNQSSLYAVAEGLKKPAILEIFYYHADVLHFREGITHGWTENVFLPEI